MLKVNYMRTKQKCQMFVWLHYKSLFHNQKLTVVLKHVFNKYAMLSILHNYSIVEYSCLALKPDSDFFFFKRPLYVVPLC